MAALFALAVQFVLSFGHMHPEEFFALSLAHSLARVGVPVSPSTPNPAVPGDDACAICISMAMVGSSALPALVVVLPPAGLGRVGQALPSPRILASAPRLPFRSRAPPAA